MSQSQQHTTTCKPKRVMRLLCRNSSSYYDGSCGGSLVYDQSLGTPQSVTGFIGSVGVARIFYIT